METRPLCLHVGCCSQGHRLFHFGRSCFPARVQEQPGLCAAEGFGGRGPGGGKTGAGAALPSLAGEAPPFPRIRGTNLKTRRPFVHGKSTDKRRGSCTGRRGRRQEAPPRTRSARHEEFHPSVGLFPDLRLRRSSSHQRTHLTEQGVSWSLGGTGRVGLKRGLQGSHTHSHSEVSVGY